MSPHPDSKWYGRSMERFPAVIRHPPNNSPISPLHSASPLHNSRPLPSGHQNLPVKCLEIPPSRNPTRWFTRNLRTILPHLYHLHLPAHRKGSFAGFLNVRTKIFMYIERVAIILLYDVLCFSSTILTFNDLPALLPAVTLQGFVQRVIFLSRKQLSSLINSGKFPQFPKITYIPIFPFCKIAEN